MRKFLVILLLPIFFKSVQVVSTENPVIIPKQEIYSLTHGSYDLYYQDAIESPRFYGETPIYSSEDLIKESGKVNSETKLTVLEWRLNSQGIAVFKLSNNQFVAADKRLVYDESTVNSVVKQVWLKPEFIIYNSPYDQTEKTHTLSPYQKIEGDMLVFAEGREFLRLKQGGWISLEDISEEDNRIEKVQELLSSNYQNDHFSIYVKQLSTGKEAGINENQRMYAASIMKLPYLYYVQEKINQGDVQLDTALKYVPEVNEFPGSYKPEGSGSLPKKADNKEYSVKDLITKTAKESDNVAHNILGYYITNKSDETFKQQMTVLSGENWDVTDKLASAKMAGQVMESIYNQNGFVLESLSKTSYDNQRIAKNISVSVAHKIGDADEFKHDTGVVYTESPFIISIFTKNSDYDTISKIAKDVYEVLK
jgi:beta-lactamase